MIIDWTREFDNYLSRLESDAAVAGGEAEQRLVLLLAELDYLKDLTTKPLDDTPTLKRVRQSRRYPLWRVSHPYAEGIALRLIVWFPSNEHLVVALFAGDKARIGDVFYDSVSNRADPAIDIWKQQFTSGKDIQS